MAMECFVVAASSLVVVGRVGAAVAGPIVKVLVVETFGPFGGEYYH